MVFIIMKRSNMLYIINLGITLYWNVLTIFSDEAKRSINPFLLVEQDRGYNDRYS
ncbi:MAG: hypothetical protein GX640_01460 [Fibrobacter sp.]|nr:hypothetical protein [Fibrobacter sp.]